MGGGHLENTLPLWHRPCRDANIWHHDHEGQGKGLVLEVRSRKYLAEVAQVPQDLHNLEGGRAVQPCTDFIHEENVLGAAHHLAWTARTTQRTGSPAKSQAKCNLKYVSSETLRSYRVGRSGPLYVDQLQSTSESSLSMQQQKLLTHAEAVQRFCPQNDKGMAKAAC